MAWLCRLSAALLVIGFFSMLLFGIDSPLLFVYQVLFVIGCGIGMMLGPITNMMIRTAPIRKRGMMSGIVELERLTPFMMNSAILPLILTEYVSQGFSSVSVYVLRESDSVCSDTLSKGQSFR